MNHWLLFCFVLFWMSDYLNMRSEFWLLQKNVKIWQYSTNIEAKKGFVAGAFSALPAHHSGTCTRRCSSFLLCWLLSSCREGTASASSRFLCWEKNSWTCARFSSYRRLCLQWLDLFETQIFSTVGSHFDFLNFGAIKVDFTHIYICIVNSTRKESEELSKANTPYYKSDIGQGRDCPGTWVGNLESGVLKPWPVQSWYASNKEIEFSFTEWNKGMWASLKTELKTGYRATSHPSPRLSHETSLCPDVQRCPLTPMAFSFAAQESFIKYLIIHS